MKKTWWGRLTESVHRGTEQVNERGLKTLLLSISTWMSQTSQILVWTYILIFPLYLNLFQTVFRFSKWHYHITAPWLLLFLHSPRVIRHHCCPSPVLKPSTSMSITIMSVQDTITSSLDNRFLTGPIVSGQPLFNSVGRATFLLPKSDHVTLLKNLFRVFYYLSLWTVSTCIYHPPMWTHPKAISLTIVLLCSLFSSSTGLSLGIFPSHLGA